MFKVLLRNIKQSKSSIQTLFAVSAFLLLFNLVFDLFYTVKFGGVDLRDKVVGSRILLTDHPMYYSWWAPSDSERFLNPQDDPKTPLSLYTGTPFQSLAFLPIASLPYPIIRYLWFGLQYLFLGLLLLPFVKKAKGAVIPSLLLIGGSTFFFLSTDQWHMHVERGQFYVLFALLIGSIYFTLESNIKNKEWLAGILLGILILFKPTYAIFGVPFFFRKQIKILAGTTLTVVVAGLLFLGTHTANRWVEYSGAMKEWQAANLDLAGAVGAPTAEDLAQMPFQIEGMTNLNRRGTFFSENSCLQHIIFSKTGIKVDTKYFYLLAIGLMLGILASLYPAFLQYHPKELILLGFLLWVITTICLPAPRFIYQYVHWIVPLAIIAVDYKKYSTNIHTLLLIGLTLNLGIRFFTITIPYVFFVGELFLILGLFLVLRTPTNKETSTLLKVDKRRSQTVYMHE